MTSSNVLDSSALICFFRKENGWQKVSEILEDICYISSINLAEFYTWIIRNGFDFEITKSLIDDLELEVIDFSTDQSEQIALLYAKTFSYGLSLGDRACICLGVQLKLPVITADKIWAKLTIANLKVVLIR